MSLTEWIYTPNGHIQTSQDTPVTFVSLVNSEMVPKWKKDKSIALANVVDSFEVFKYENGRSGKKFKPSKRELEDVFGTTNMDEILQIILEKGEGHGKQSAGEKNYEK